MTGVSLFRVYTNTKLKHYPMKKSLYEQPSVDVIDFQLDESVAVLSASPWGGVDAAGLMDNETEEYTHTY